MNDNVSPVGGMSRAVILGVLLLSASCATRSLESVAIRAERNVYCGPAWDAEFSPIAARQRVVDTCLRPREYVREFSVSSEQWQHIQEALRRSGFRHLPADILFQNEDGAIMIAIHGDYLCIEILDPPPSHRVCAQPTALTNSLEGTRFLDVWTELTKIAPEPKP